MKPHLSSLLIQAAIIASSCSAWAAGDAEVTETTVAPPAAGEMQWLSKDTVPPMAVNPSRTGCKATNGEDGKACVGASRDSSGKLSFVRCQALGPNICPSAKDCYDQMASKVNAQFDACDAKTPPSAACGCYEPLCGAPNTTVANATGTLAESSFIDACITRRKAACDKASKITDALGAAEACAWSGSAEWDKHKFTDSQGKDYSATQFKQEWLKRGGQDATSVGLNWINQVSTGTQPASGFAILPEEVCSGICKAAGTDCTNEIKGLLEARQKEMNDFLADQFAPGNPNNVKGCVDNAKNSAGYDQCNRLCSPSGSSGPNSADSWNRFRSFQSACYRFIEDSRVKKVVEDNTQKTNAWHDLYTNYAQSPDEMHLKFPYSKAVEFQDKSQGDRKAAAKMGVEFFRAEAKRFKPWTSSDKHWQDRYVDTCEQTFFDAWKQVPKGERKLTRNPFDMSDQLRKGENGWTFCRRLLSESGAAAK